MAGRRPKPTALKKLQGNPGGRPLNDSEPNAPVGMPEIPKGMGHVATRYFKRLCADLLTTGLLTTVDGLALANHCKAEALGEKYFKDALEEPYVFEHTYDKEGHLIKTTKKLSPASLGFIACSKASKGYLTEFGLTPASRAKLHVEKPKPADEFPTREAAMADEPKQTDSLLDSIDETVVLQ
jgi:P27 family predicted phage terminase small subunit